jgi:hypothetical protein
MDLRGTSSQTRRNLATKLLEILLSNKVGAEFVRRLSGESVSLVRDSTFLFDQC